MPLTPEQIKQLNDYANKTNKGISSSKTQSQAKPKAPNVAAERLNYEQAKTDALKTALEETKARKKPAPVEPSINDILANAEKGIIANTKEVDALRKVRKVVGNATSDIKNAFGSEAPKVPAAKDSSNVNKVSGFLLSSLGKGLGATHPGLTIMGKANAVAVEKSKPLKELQNKAITGAVDLASRGQYMSASYTSKLTELARKNPSKTLSMFAPGGVNAYNAKDSKSLMAAAYDGVTGKKKMSYYQVLKENGINNKIILGVLGFAGDVLLDPANYVSLGLAKPLSQATLAKAGAEAAENAVKKTTADIINKSYVNRGKTLKPGRPAHKAAVAAETAKIDMEAIAKAASDKVVQTLQAANPGAIQFKVGHTVLGQSKATYVGGRTLKDKVIESKIGNTLTEGFSTKYIDVDNTGRVVSAEGLNHSRRKIVNGGMHDSQNTIAKQRVDWDIITPEEGDMITNYRERGVIVPSEFNKPLTNDPTRTLGEFITKTEKHFDNLFSSQGTIGVINRSAADYIKNYVPMYANKGLPSAIRLEKTTRKLAKQEGTDLTGHKLLDLKDQFKPMTNMKDIISMSLQENYHKATYAQWKDEAITQYGIKPTSKAALKAAEAKGMVEFADGIYMHPNIKKVMEAVDDIRLRTNDSHDMLNKLSELQNLWKFSVTALRPGHHVTNFIGDFVTSMVDGNSMKNMKDSLLLFSGKSNLGGNFRRIKRSDGTFITKTFDELKDMYYRSGADAGFHSADVGLDAEAPKTWAGKTLNTRPVKRIRKASEARESSIRFSHWLSSVEDGVRRGLPDAKAIDEAADRVLKFEKDYGDFTKFEKSVKKGPIPFYAWFRKNTPLMLEMLMTKPAKAIAPLKGVSNAAMALTDGEESQYRGIPSAWQELSKVIANKADGAQIIFSDKLPITDTLRMLSNPFGSVPQQIKEGLSPLGTVPLNTFTDAKMRPGLEGKSKLRMLLEAAPFGSLISTLTEGRTNKNDGSAMKDNEQKALAFARMLTGFGIEKSTAHQKAGQFERKSKKLREELKKLEAKQ